MKIEQAKAYYSDVIITGIEEVMSISLRVTSLKIAI